MPLHNDEVSYADAETADDFDDSGEVTGVGGATTGARGSRALRFSHAWLMSRSSLLSVPLDKDLTIFIFAVGDVFPLETTPGISLTKHPDRRNREGSWVPLPCPTSI
jgi:hypothetical protein